MNAYRSINPFPHQSQGPSNANRTRYLAFVFEQVRKRQMLTRNPWGKRKARPNQTRPSAVSMFRSRPVSTELPACRYLVFFMNSDKRASF